MATAMMISRGLPWESPRYPTVFHVGFRGRPWATMATAMGVHGRPRDPTIPGVCYNENTNPVGVSAQAWNAQQGHHRVHDVVLRVGYHAASHAEYHAVHQVVSDVVFHVVHRIVSHVGYHAVSRWCPT